jgi:hypothetical protein
MIHYAEIGAQAGLIFEKMAAAARISTQQPYRRIPL